MRAAARAAPTVGNGPGVLVRQTQAQAWNRTSGNFCKPRAQWPGGNSDQSLRFCAPEILQNPSRMRPPQRGPGKGDYEHEVLIWSRPRGRFAFFFAMEKEGRRPQAAKYPAHNERNPNPAPSSGPSGHLSLSPLAFGHLPLTRGVGPQGEGRMKGRPVKFPPKFTPLP